MAARSPRTSPLRMVGIIWGLVMTVTMACYLIWAVTERSKLRGRRGNCEHIEELMTQLRAMQLGAVAAGVSVALQR